MASAQATLVSAKMDTSKFEEWWLDKNIERYAAPLRSAIDGRLAALEDSFGLPTADLRAEIAGLQGGKDARALIGRLEGILQKLSPDRIPAKFLGEGPQKLARLHAYGLNIATTEDALREATKGLPPMPGSSKAYETWYDQVAVRMNNNAARLAHLRGLEAEAERAEYEALVAAQRVKERAERLAAEKAEHRQRKGTRPPPQRRRTAKIILGRIRLSGRRCVCRQQRLWRHRLERDDVQLPAFNYAGLLQLDTRDLRVNG